KDVGEGASGPDASGLYRQRARGTERDPDLRQLLLRGANPVGFLPRHAGQGGELEVGPPEVERRRQIPEHGTSPRADVRLDAPEPRLEEADQRRVVEGL